MADNIALNPGTGGDTIAADDIGGVKYSRTKLVLGAEGVNDGDVAASNPLPVTGPLTDAQIRATALPVSAASLPLPSGAATEATLAGAINAEDAASSSGAKGIVALAIRQDVDALLVNNDGDYSFLKTDGSGRLKVATQPGLIVATTGTITANGQTVSVDVSRASNVMLHCTGTFSTINCTFEGSIDGGTNWFAVQCIRSNANTIELTTGNLSAAPAYAWEASVNGLTHFRVRATAYTSGTQTWRFQPGPYATEPIPGAQVSGTQPVSLTSTTVSGVTPTASNINSAASTNATSVKGSAGTVWSVMAFNAGAGVAFVKYYNKATAPTVGTDVPIWCIAVPAGGHAQVEFAVQGNRFGTGIALAITGAAADTDTTAVAAAQVKVSTAYT